VPGFLGRVIGVDGQAVGTCFQVAPGVVVTAYHVLADLHATRADSVVEMGQLDGDELPVKARVLAVDQLHDLAVLRPERPLRSSKDVMIASDRVKASSDVTVTGWVRVADPGHDHEFLQSGGVWRGPARRDGVLWGRVQADAVMPGMSGAPVLRLSDGAILGVVSGRYNTVDGWLAGSVWVSRTEDLVSLLDGLAPVGTGLRSSAVGVSAAQDDGDRGLGGGPHAAEDRMARWFRSRTGRMLVATVAALFVLVTGAAVALSHPLRDRRDQNGAGPPKAVPSELTASSASASPTTSSAASPEPPTSGGDVIRQPTVRPNVNPRATRSGGFSIATRGPVALTPPILVSPPDEIVYTVPDTVTFAWEAVSGASEYILETEATDGENWRPLEMHRQTERTRTYSWPGWQAFRWRVKALGADGEEGPSSEWRRAYNNPNQ
jgi:hypothetical protein